MNDKKKRTLPFDIGDVASLAGAALVIYGVAEVYRPAALVLGGLALLAIGISVHRRKARS